MSPFGMWWEVEPKVEVVELVACILIPVQVAGTEHERMKSCDICDLCLVMSPINSMGGSRDKPHKPRNDSPLLHGILKSFGPETSFARLNKL
jgi:hypothetical protein